MSEVVVCVGTRVEEGVAGDVDITNEYEIPVTPGRHLLHEETLTTDTDGGRIHLRLVVEVVADDSHDERMRRAAREAELVWVTAADGSGKPLRARLVRWGGGAKCRVSFSPERSATIEKVRVTLMAPIESNKPALPDDPKGE